MTPQEALKFLDEHFTASVVPFDVKVLCSNALEKQITKKVFPLSVGVPNDYSVCPYCDCAFHRVEGVVPISFCPRCGQALDWSDNK